jgi:pimeloyl-ACP methyl ester carboxylesterase
MLAQWRAASRYAAPPESHMRQVIAAAKHDVYDRLQYVECPVMIIHGAEDVMIPPGNAHLLKQHIPHAELHILEGMGHGYNLEAQEEADALVIDFVRRYAGVIQGSARAAG